MIACSKLKLSVLRRLAFYYVHPWHLIFTVTDSVGVPDDDSMNSYVVR